MTDSNDGIKKINFQRNYGFAEVFFQTLTVLNIKQKPSLDVSTSFHMTDFLNETTAKLTEQLIYGSV